MTVLSVLLGLMICADFRTGDQSNLLTQRTQFHHADIVYLDHLKKELVDYLHSLETFSILKP